VSRRDSQWAGIVAGAAGLSLVVGLVAMAVVGKPPARKDSTEPPLAKPPVTPPDDVEALARCLRSEDDDPAIQIAIGWIVRETARRRRVSIFDLLTAGHGYGPQKVFVSGRALIRFAATDKPASDTTMLLAAALLAGTVEPQSAFRWQPQRALWSEARRASDLVRTVVRFSRKRQWLGSVRYKLTLVASWVEWGAGISIGTGHPS
jgi:hypothetical protein